MSLATRVRHIPSDSGAMMQRMNPKWRDSSYSEIDLDNEHCASWLCDPAEWTNYKTANSSFAIGSPSVEMFMKAFNLWKAGNENANNLECKVESANGYTLLSNGAIFDSGEWTSAGSLEPGPNRVFNTSSNAKTWLSSPSMNDGDSLVYAHKGVNIAYAISNTRLGSMPVVPLDL